MKRKIEFLDADRIKVVAECEITTRNSYPEFTMSGEYAGSLGQVFDQVNPATDGQKKLIDIWKEWHLNDMNAGTKEQRAEIDKLEDKDYKKIVEHLKLVGLYEVPHPVTGEPYRYGSGWLRKDLPEDFEDELDELLDAIEEYEEEQQERPVDDNDEGLFDEFDEPQTAFALALMLDLTLADIEDIKEEGNNRWCVQGVDYLAGTDDEMDDAWDEYLDDYLRECVYPDLPETARRYFDDDAWKFDARMDDRGHSLNRYNGGELSYKVGDIWYYAYRQ